MEALILQGGADVNLAAYRHLGRVPLTLAIGSGHAGLAHLLVKHGADPDLRDNRGQTVWEACDLDHFNVCEDLRCFIRLLYHKRSRITEL